MKPDGDGGVSYNTLGFGSGGCVVDTAPRPENNEPGAPVGVEIPGAVLNCPPLVFSALVVAGVVEGPNKPPVGG